MKFEIVKSEGIYQGKALNLQRESVRYPDRRVATIELIKHGGSVAIVPVDEKGVVWFVRQYRHPVGDMLLELPAGTLEEGEKPEDCAAREVREEIGMAADYLEKIGEFFVAPGYSSEYMHIFLATKLRADPLEQDANEYIQVEKYPAEQVYEMIGQGEIKDAKTIAGLSLARPLLIRA